MPVVEAYDHGLAALQNVWDSLSLLSQMSGDGTDKERWLRSAVPSWPMPHSMRCGPMKARH